MVKDVSEFHARKDRKSNIRSACKECNFFKTIKRKYGIDRPEYLGMLLKQNWNCSICEINIKQAKLVVDHCHASGDVRGLLCNLCNRALGNFRDDTQVMQRAIEYIKKSGKK